MQLMTEYLEGTTQNIFVEEAGQKQLYIEGIFMQAAVKNKNGRFYPTQILENAVNTYIEEAVKTNSAIGELNHPKSPIPNPNKASHRIVELHKDGNDFYGKALVLDTRQGKQVRALIEGGVRMGVSSRGLGTCKAVNGVNEVQNNYVLKCVDVVHNPSAPNAFVNGIMEGVDFGMDGKVVEHIEQTIKATPKGQLDATKIQLFKDAMRDVYGLEKMRVNESKSVTWNGRPNLNGNTPENFRSAGRDMHMLAGNAKKSLQNVMSEIVHGRNYQHNQALRQVDNDRLNKIFDALRDLEKIGEDLYTIGDNRHI